MLTLLKDDSQRYPEVVQYSSLPEAVQHSKLPEAVQHDDPKYCPPLASSAQEAVPAQRTDQTYADQTAVSSASPGTSPDLPSTASYSAKEVLEPAATDPKQPRKYCGLRKRTFIIVIVVAVILIVGAIVGGVVGGLAAAGNLGSSASDGDNDSDDDADEEHWRMNPSGDLGASDRMVAASVAATNTTADFQIFYQTLDSSNNISYRLFWDDEAQSEQTLNLTQQPYQGSPLAAVAEKPGDDGDFHVNLFYMSITSRSRGSEPVIVRARLQCSLGAESCDLLANPIISSGVDYLPHDNTTLAALWFRESDSLRVYFQEAGEDIYVLSSDQEQDEDATDWSAQRIDGPAREGTSVVAFQTEKSSSVNVAFVGQNSRLSRYEYRDIYGADDGQSVDDSPGSSWRPSARLAAAYVPTAKNSRIYYSAENVGEIMSYWQNSTAAEDEEWNTHQSDTWDNVRVTGGFAAIGWARECRLVFYDGNEETWGVLNQSNATWSGPNWI